MGGAKGFEIVNTKIDLEEIQGELSEVCHEKCRAAARIVDGPVFMEDTCLGFRAQEGFPGPYIKSYLEKLRVERLPSCLPALTTSLQRPPAPSPTATAQAVSRSSSSGRRARARSFIVKPGGEGFGFGAVFRPDGSDQTYAAMSPETRRHCTSPNRLSSCVTIS